MKIIKSGSISNAEQLALIQKTTREKGIFIYPTDTLYGIGGDPYSIEVIKKIDKIKGRADKPYSVAVSSFEMLKGIVKNIPEIFFAKYLKLLPGKYTFLFEVAYSIESCFLKGSNKIGVRIPDTPEILQLIGKLGHPIITTSVNETGDMPLNSFNSIIEFIKARGLEKEIAFIIDGGELPLSAGSIIIDLTKDVPEYIPRELPT